MNTVIHISSCPFSHLLAISANLYELLRPGDYLKPGEDEIEGLRARLDERLSPVVGDAGSWGEDGVDQKPSGEWEIGDCIAQWWRPGFETFMVSNAVGLELDSERGIGVVDPLFLSSFLSTPVPIHTSPYH